jgi:hypothetical protein
MRIRNTAGAALQLSTCYGAVEHLFRVGNWSGVIWRSFWDPILSFCLCLIFFWITVRALLEDPLKTWQQFSDTFESVRRFFSLYFLIYDPTEPGVVWSCHSTKYTHHHPSVCSYSSAPPLPPHPIPHSPVAKKQIACVIYTDRVSMTLTISRCGGLG